MPMMLRFSVTTSLLLTLSTAASGQSSFSLLRDSLAGLRSITDVRRLGSSGREARDAGTFVRNGFVALRLYDLTAKSQDVRAAQKAFGQAIELDPNSGWAWYGLGLSLARSPEALPLNRGGKRGTFVVDDVARKLAGRDPRSRARKAFTAAIEKAPELHGAALQLAELAIADADRNALSEAREQLLALRDHSGEVALALSRVEAARGDLPAARAAAEHALAAGADSALALHALAVALLRTPGMEQDGLQRYREGLARASGKALDFYYEDVYDIADKTERLRWNTGDEAARRDLLAHFFDLRAALDGRRVEQRMAAHYQRLAHAEVWYRRKREFGAPAAPAVRWVDIRTLTRFDDRGEIYLRHGEPVQVVRSGGTDGLLTSESWYYDLPNGKSRMFHFLGGGPDGDYFLASQLPCDGDYLADRVHLDPRLRAVYASCSGMNQLMLAAELRDDGLTAFETDTDVPYFSRELPFLYDLYTFRGTAGQTAVVAAIAVPGDALESRKLDNSVLYRLDLSLILADTAQMTVKRLDDSARIHMPRRLSEDELLRAHLEVEVAPSSSIVQRVIVTDPTVPGIGQLYGGPFPIPDYSGADLMISDIAFAEPDTVGTWKRGEVSLALVPSDQFREGTFNVFYELYNLPKDTPYRTEIIIEPVRGSIRRLFGSDPIRLRFDGVSTAGPDGVLQELRRVTVPMRKGQYRMTIVVKNLASGEETRKQREFSIP